MDQSKASLLVVIVTYNGMKWLDKCLSSVTNSSIKADLFIVDNGSSDGSIEFIKTSYPESIFFESKENLGFGQANNMGLKYAIDNNYDYVYLLNQDAWVEPNTFEKLITVSHDNPEYGILSPLQTNRDTTKLDKIFYDYCPIDLLSDFVCNQQVKSVYEVEFVMAAHWLISEKTIKHVGGFSPTFSHYGEDNNYIHRAKYWGFKVGIVPKCIGIHDRENRELSVSKIIHIAEMTWRYNLSNPIDSKNIRIKKTLRSYVLYFLKNPWITTAKMISVLKNYNKINKNLIASVSNKCAFLK